jgi:predicted MFS family arabinose efflux permease
MKALIYLSIVLGVLAQAAFVLQMGKVSAILITISTSIPQQIALLTMLTLVARVCPDKSEGFTYALIMSVYNLSTQYSATLGAGWYDSVFAQNIVPLIWISAGVTALCFLLVPFLPRASLEPQQPPNPPNASPPPAQSGPGDQSTP